MVKLGCSSLTDRVNTEQQMARPLQRMSLHSLAVKYVLSAYYVPHIPLGSMDRMSTEDKIPTFKELIFYWGDTIEQINKFKIVLNVPKMRKQGSTRECK